MKKLSITLPSLLSLVLSLFFTSCDKNERDINLTITPVGAFYAPNDNLSVKLEPATSASVVFEWESAKAEDGALVMYELGFDKVGGDFSAPVYKISSDGNGVQNKLTLSHKDLNRIANLAGIKSLEKGKLIWTVYAIKGTNVLKAATNRTIEVERPAGFAEIPTELFLSGTGTEVGAGLSTAIKLKSVGSGLFEVYTQLKSGTLHFTSKNTGTPVSYIYQGAALKEGEEVPSPTTTPKVYRMELDFNNATFKFTEIVSIGLWFSPRNAIEADIPYAGLGKFKATSTPIAFKQESWGRDERYKFRINIKNSDGTTGVEEWASSVIDNSRATAASPASYFFLNKQNVDQWNYSYKFQTEADNKNAEITVSFSPDGPYTHVVKVL